MSGPLSGSWLRRARAAPLCLAVLAACHRSAPPPPPARVELAGVRLPLVGPGVRLAVRGWVDRSPAEVLLDVAAPLSTVTRGCFVDGPPPSPGTVRVPLPEGGYAEYPEILLPDSRLDDVQVGLRRAGLVQRRGCTLTLGSAVLGRYALQVDPVRREVVFAPPRPRDAYLREVASAPLSEEAYAVELSRDPTGDWPLLSPQVAQGDARLAGPFVLSTREARSSISEPPARQAGFVSEVAELRAAGVALEHSGPSGYALDALELVPGLRLARARLVGNPRWSNAGALGALGGDVWGRFQATIDLGAGLLVLRRPKVLATGSSQRCAGPAGEGASEERCFVLQVEPEPSALNVTAALWRDLPEGGRLYLQPLDAEGQPLSTGCQVGFTFEPSDRGATAAYRLPWASLDKSLSPCAKALAQARGVALGLFEEGALAECPGDCAFATHLRSRRTRCQCPLPGPASLTDAERRMLQRLRPLHSKPRPERPAPDEEPEPVP